MKNIYFKTLNIYFFSITIKNKFLKLKVNMLKTLPRLLPIFTVVSTLMFSSTSSAEWTEVTENTVGDIFYVDFERIRKHDGYIYYWQLIDILKPTESRFLSAKRYFQGDCKLFRFKILSYVFHKQPMGRDVGETSNKKNPEWRYPHPGSADETVLREVCSIYE